MVVVVLRAREFRAAEARLLIKGRHGCVGVFGATRVTWADGRVVECRSTNARGSRARALATQTTRPARYISRDASVAGSSLSASPFCSPLVRRLSVRKGASLLPLV